MAGGQGRLDRRRVAGAGHGPGAGVVLGGPDALGGEAPAPAGVEHRLLEVRLVGPVPGHGVSQRLQQPAAGDGADQLAGRRPGQDAAAVAQDGQVEQEPVGRLVGPVQRQAVRHPRPHVQVDREPWAPLRRGHRGPGVEHELQPPQRPGHGQLAERGGDGPAALLRRFAGADGHHVDVAPPGRDPAQRPRPHQVGGHQLVAEQLPQPPGDGPPARLDQLARLHLTLASPADGFPVHCPWPRLQCRGRPVRAQPPWPEARGGRGPRAVGWWSSSASAVGTAGGRADGGRRRRS